MKIEKLRKSHKKKIIIGGLITLSIISTITFVTTRAKYKVTQNIKLASGTVNYKVPDLNMVAMYQENSSGGWDDVSVVPTSGYTLNTTNSKCTISGTKDNTISITYSDGKVAISNLTKKGTKCYLYFDKIVSVPASEVIASIKNTAKTTTPSFNSTATTDEGIYKVSDGMYGGTSYYWRGAVTNNHVIFANKCWRIIRINGDDTIRLIYNGSVLTGNTCTGNVENEASIAVAGQSYNSTNQSNYVGWTYSGTLQRPTNNATGTASNAKTQTDTWYNENIDSASASYVADGKFCNDRNVTSGSYSTTGSTFDYAAYTRFYTNKNNPVLSCPTGDVYTIKAGAITADEVILAGGKDSTDNTSYYLYNGQAYWTMTPGRWYQGMQTVMMYMVSDTGNVLGNSTSGGGKGIRPVINLKSSTKFILGATGTKSNPYIVK